MFAKKLNSQTERRSNVDWAIEIGQLKWESGFESKSALSSPIQKDGCHTDRVLCLIARQHMCQSFPFTAKHGKVLCLHGFLHWPIGTTKIYTKIENVWMSLCVLWWTGNLSGVFPAIYPMNETHCDHG